MEVSESPAVVDKALRVITGVWPAALPMVVTDDEHIDEEPCPPDRRRGLRRVGHLPIDVLRLARSEEGTSVHQAAQRQYSRPAL